MAPYCFARSRMAPIGAMSASIEYTDSKAISFGAAGGAARNNASRCAMSLCWNIEQTARDPLIPAIIEAWLRASENPCHGWSRPLGRLFRMVDSAAWLETKPEVN